MKRKIILSVSVVVIFVSCNQVNKKSLAFASESNKELSLNAQQPSEGHILLKSNCYVCHNPHAESHDVIIAPPFRAVKMRYSRVYDKKEDFVNAIVNWVQNPEEEKALMFGAVKQFKVMPKLPLPTEDLEKIATYLYENDVEEPIWMEQHMKEEHDGNLGKGKGQMRNNRRGNRHKVNN